MVALTQRGRKRTLIALNCALAAGILIALVAAMLPVEVESPTSIRPHQSNGPDSSGVITATKPLAAYAVIHQRNVRAPLFDPQRQPDSQAPPPKLRLTLRGTMVEPGSSFAILAVAGKPDQLASVGDTIADAELVAIESGSVTVMYHGRSITLTVPQEGAQSR